MLLAPAALDWMGELAVGVSSMVSADLTELRPSEKPSPKKIAHTTTKPKNRPSSRPVPRVISVSCDSAIPYAPDLVLLSTAFTCAVSRFWMPCMISIGMGNTMVVFFSAPISVSVCK